MSEEEIIKILQKIAEDEQEFYNTDSIIQRTAIQGLLDLYQKEKEKNKEVIDYIEKNKEKFKILDYAYPEAVINHFNKINKILKGE